MSKNVRKEIEQEMMKLIHQGRMREISEEQIKEIIETTLEFRLNYQLIDENLKGKDGRNNRKR